MSRDPGGGGGGAAAGAVLGPGRPRPPPSPESSPEAQGRGERAAVLHQTRGGRGACGPGPVAWPALQPLPLPRARLGLRRRPPRKAGAAGRAGTSRRVAVPGLPAPKPLRSPSPRAERRRRAAGATAAEALGAARASRVQPAARWSRPSSPPDPHAGGPGLPGAGPGGAGGALAPPFPQGMPPSSAALVSLPPALPAARPSAPLCSGSASPPPAALHPAGSAGSKGPGCH